MYKPTKQDEQANWKQLDKERGHRTGFDKYLVWNMSTYFLVRPITETNIAEHVKGGFINSYCYYNNENFLFLLYKENDYYPELLFSLRRNSNFVEEIELGENVMLKFNIPDSYTEDLKLFWEGKYSNFSLFFKKQFEKYLKDPLGREFKSLQWRIFEKDEELKKEIEEYIGEKLPTNIDYFFLPNKQKETYETV